MASFDVIFLGGGPAGYVGAIRCAQLGLNTAVVEREGLGGTCVLWGCIPAKALLEAGHIADRLKHAPEFGVTPGEVKLDFGVAMKRSRAVSSQNSKGVEFLFKKNKITWIRGTAKLAGKNSVSVKTADGKEEKHDAKKAVVISTGSRVKGLPQIGLELNKKTVISSDEALILEKAPKSIIIVGAGAVGSEFADVFNAFGSQVTLVEVMPSVLPVEDADSSKEVERSFRKRGIAVLTGAKISSVKVGRDSVSMSIEAGGEKKDYKSDIVLVAAGRAPNVEDIGLKEQGVQLTDRGFIKIDKKMQTSVPGIYAIGDVIDGPMLAHKASEDGVACVETLAGQKGHVDWDLVPSVIYTQPEVAWVGKTEEQLKAAGVAYKVGKYPFLADPRSRANAATEGFAKVLADKATDEVLGVHIIGAEAGTMIAEAAMAMEFKASAEDVGRVCHAHPTVNEALKEAALAAWEKPIHL